ncbi:MAG: alpha/beta fold hydrolase [Alphaproteobacteria bacterium]|nr:alpha/beta fold hydrolase [Alphaproteobacteria bacterium]
MTELRLGSMVIEDSGDGPAVVMVHGLGGTSNSFQPLIGGLDGFRVLRPDLPGAGRSATRPGLPGLAGLASAVRDTMRAAGVARAHFVGHSMGTLICQYIAAERPETVASLVLFGPILEPPTAARAALKERAEVARSAGMAAIADAVAAGSVADGHPAAAAFVRESLMRQDPAGYAAHCSTLSVADVADHAAIGCPTLLIAGDKDPVAPVDMARHLQQAIAGARLEIVPGVGHWMMLEAPQRSAELLRAHLDETALKCGQQRSQGHDRHYFRRLGRKTLLQRRRTRNRFQQRAHHRRYR